MKEEEIPEQEESGEEGRIHSTLRRMHSLKRQNLVLFPETILVILARTAHASFSIY